CTGQAGDMFICHGFMPHSASKNHLRIPRFITSPKFVLEHPFNLNREDPSDYSLVEKKTLGVLGVPSLPDWKITGERARFVAPNNGKKDSRLPLELERLKAHAAKTGGVVESIHLQLRLTRVFWEMLNEETACNDYLMNSGLTPSKYGKIFELSAGNSMTLRLLQTSRSNFTLPLGLDFKEWQFCGTKFWPAKRADSEGYSPYQMYLPIPTETPQIPAVRTVTAIVLPTHYQAFVLPWTSSYWVWRAYHV
ncbi:hypothetical protein BDZ94DRAFT_1242180, partial [Collybia nuda]